MTTELDCVSAEALGGRICAAGLAAQADARLIELIGEFDDGNAVRRWDGVASLAHWLTWACSMSPGTAREHVRVARALRRMPVVRAAFAEGRLSYSKVREVTRVVDTVDDARLCELALCATAAQLAKIVSGYRTAAGHRIHQERDRRLTWTERETGVVDFRLRLPKEEAAVVLAALTAAEDQHSSPPAPAIDDGQVDTTPRYTLADAAVDVARTFLAATPEDRSGEDRTLVVVQVGLDQLAADRPSSIQPEASEPEASAPVDVPAGTSPDCQIQGLGGIEAETARKLSCDSDLLGAVLDRRGDVLALGRTRRLVSRSQRRALMIRDHGLCQFTGCHRTRHLRAHHVVHWADGGRTDLSNLILLCQYHHTAVHEGQMIIRRSEHGWEFRMPDGTPHRAWWSAEGLSNFLAQHADQGQAARQRVRHDSTIEGVTSFHHPDARRIQPGWRGERFDRHEAVQAMFRMPVRAPAARPTERAA